MSQETQLRHNVNMCVILGVRINASQTRTSLYIHKEDNVNISKPTAIR